MTIFNVTYYELSNYNNGTLLSRTFDLSEGTTKESHYDELNEWLAELTEQTGELCEEWIIADIEGVPSSMYSEWSVDDEFFEFIEFVSDTHLDLEVVEAAMELGIPLDAIEDAYYGQYDSEEELAEEYVESTGMLDSMPENLRFYFDMAAFGQDLAMDFLEHNGHYFHGSW